MINVNMYRRIHLKGLVDFTNMTSEIYKTQHEIAANYAIVNDLPLVAVFHLSCEVFGIDSFLISKINMLLDFYQEKLTSDIKLEGIEYRS
jgi:hypothetical protein